LPIAYRRRDALLDRVSREGALDQQSSLPHGWRGEIRHRAFEQSAPRDGFEGAKNDGELGSLIDSRTLAGAA
jgi:hypothetical protein